MILRVKRTYWRALAAHPTLNASGTSLLAPGAPRNIGCKISQFSRPFTGPLRLPVHLGPPSLFAFLAGASSVRSATRYFGSGQKEFAGEEALRR
jgi:hypothetical protein